jgi:hypothetical protein
VQLHLPGAMETWRRSYHSTRSGPGLAKAAAIPKEQRQSLLRATSPVITIEDLISLIHFKITITHCMNNSLNLRPQILRLRNIILNYFITPLHDIFLLTSSWHFLATGVEQCPLETPLPNVYPPRSSPEVTATGGWDSNRRSTNEGNVSWRRQPSIIR